jgi:hypothetical protein
MMGKVTRSVILCLLFVAVPFGRKADATTVLFNFNSAPSPGGVSAIETYMEGIYGSDITVSGSTAVQIVEKSAGERCIRSPMLATNVSFSFNNVSITSVSFDWSARLIPEAPPLIVHYNVYADDVMFFGNEYGSGNSGTIFFATPVKTLRFSFGGFGNANAEIDNLTVTPVPEPATAALLALGALITFAKRKNQRIICTEAIR